MAANTVAAADLWAMQVDVSVPTALVAQDMNGRVKVKDRDMGTTSAITKNRILS